MHFQYGLRQESLGNLDDALYHFQQALQYKPDFGLGRRYLGQVHLKKDDVDAAEAMLRQATQENPSDPEAHYLLAKISLRRKDLNSVTITPGKNDSCRSRSCPRVV